MEPSKPWAGHSAAELGPPHRSEAPVGGRRRHLEPVQHLLLGALRRVKDRYRVTAVRFPHLPTRIQTGPLERPLRLTYEWPQNVLGLLEQRLPAPLGGLLICRYCSVIRTAR